MNSLRLKLGVFLLLFIVAFATRLPFLDHNYQYSFEPDSEANIDYTRSLYFFFKNPSVSKPHELSGYPTYLDGNFVVVAISANIIRPLVASGLLDVNVRDSDNSIIIFTHRWLALIFSSLTAVLLLSCLIALESSIPIGLLIVSLIYLFSHQHLEIDFMRVDHYLVFSFLFTFRMCLSVLKRPLSNWRWVLLGIASAMLLATKLNSPLYLLMVIITAILAVIKQPSIARKSIQFFIGFIPVTILLWINWLLYPENTVSTIQETFGVAERFIGYWSVQPYFYYHFQQFVLDGQQFQTIFLLISIGWVILILLQSMKQKVRKDLFVLLTLFFVHSLYAILTSKVDRYGVFFPIYYSLIIGAALSILKTQNHNKAKATTIAICLLLSPQGRANIQNYNRLKKLAIAQEESIRITRLEPVNWISNNVLEGARVSYSRPRFTNPPVFDLPYTFIDSILTYPYWNNEGILEFLPPSFEETKNAADVFVVVDNYKQRHLNELKNYSQYDSTTLIAWQEFYDSLDQFNHKTFRAETSNYGIQEVDIYIINTNQSPITIILDNLSINRSDEKSVQVMWSETIETYGEMEIQISLDTNFNWLESNIFDGWTSKYNEEIIMEDIRNKEQLFIPPKLVSSIAQTPLSIEDKVLDWEENKYHINGFFKSIFRKMLKDSMYFNEAAFSLYGQEADVLLARLSSVYDSIDEKNIPELEGIFKIKINQQTLAKNNRKIKLPLNRSDESYFVRVRARSKEWINSRWSNIATVQ